MNPVGGDLVTTANLAVVGETGPDQRRRRKDEGIFRRRGIDAGRRVLIEEARVPSRMPPMYWRGREASRSWYTLPAAARQVDVQHAAGEPVQG